VQAYYDEIRGRLSVATAHKALMDIRSFFKWQLSIAKAVRVNPVVGVHTEPVPPSARPLWCTRKQRDQLINTATREDLKLVLMLGFHAGFRKNEIIQAVPQWFQLELRAIDMRSTPTMRFNKFKKARAVPMEDTLYTFLQAYGLRSPFLLRPDVKQGKDRYRYDFDVVLQRHVREQGMEWVTAHVMRHTFASLLVQANKSIYKVAAWMGDTVKVVEEHYGHLAVYDSDINL